MSSVFNPFVNKRNVIPFVRSELTEYMGQKSIAYLFISLSMDKHGKDARPVHHTTESVASSFPFLWAFLEYCHGVGAHSKNISALFLYC